MTKSSLGSISVILLLALLLPSCLAERDLSARFASKWKPPALLVLTPDIVLKENLKTSQVDKTPGLSAWERDSILFASSVYLKEISDSIFLENYINAFVDELRAQGYQIFWESTLDTFLAWQGDAYVLDIAQVMLEEFSIPRTDQELFDDTITYYKRIDLNGVSMHSWFDLSRVNSEEEDRNLLYASHFLQDELKGNFVRHPLRGTVSYRYTLKPVVPGDIYRLAQVLGRKYAGWLTDHFMHAFVRSSLPENVAPEAYYHLDSRSGKISRSWGDRFLLLEPQ